MKQLFSSFLNSLVSLCVKYNILLINIFLTALLNTWFYKKLPLSISSLTSRHHVTGQQFAKVNLAENRRSTHS